MIDVPTFRCYCFYFPDLAMRVTATAAAADVILYGVVAAVRALVVFSSVRFVCASEPVVFSWVHVPCELELPGDACCSLV
jgi:hypothetical protein